MFIDLEKDGERKTVPQGFDWPFLAFAIFIPLIGPFIVPIIRKDTYMIRKIFLEFIFSMLLLVLLLIGFLLSLANNKLLWGLICMLIVLILAGGMSIRLFVIIGRYNEGHMKRLEREGWKRVHNP